MTTAKIISCDCEKIENKKKFYKKMKREIFIILSLFPLYTNKFFIYYIYKVHNKGEKSFFYK